EARSGRVRAAQCLSSCHRRAICPRSSQRHEESGRMSWLTNFVLPKIRAVVAKREVTDNLWHKCPSCGQMLFHRELEAQLHVCSNCGHHLRLPPERRLAALFDDGRYAIIELPKTPADPLRFRDRRRYAERLREAQGKSGGRDAVIVAHGTIGGAPAV